MTSISWQKNLKIYITIKEKLEPLQISKDRKMPTVNILGIHSPKLPLIQIYKYTYLNLNGITYCLKCVFPLSVFPL